MRRIDDEERRRRLVLRHFLSEKASDPVSATTAMVGLHSSDPATVHLSLWARVHDFETSDLEVALYEVKNLVRVLGMRRTLWVVPTELAPSVNTSSTAPLGPPQRRRTVQMLETGGVADDGEEWLDEVGRRVLEALDDRGQATARELTEDVPALQAKITAYKKDGTVIGEFGTSTRVLFLLATEGRVVRARPLGSWVSSMYRWSTMEQWLGGPLPDMPLADARDEIVSRWLSTFGPGTETDIKWWTGWPVTAVRESLQRLSALEVELANGTGYVHPNDAEPEADAASCVAILPSLDPTTMGWKQRDWYLGDHEDRLFDRNGNAGPTVWVDGRIVGGWAQRSGGDVVFELLEDVGAETRDRVSKICQDLELWLGEQVLTPRFRTPLDKELSGG